MQVIVINALLDAKSVVQAPCFSPVSFSFLELASKLQCEAEATQCISQVKHLRCDTRPVDPDCLTIIGLGNFQLTQASLQICNMTGGMGNFVRFPCFPVVVE